MDQLGVAVAPHQQVAAEAGAEAERIDVEVRQVGQVDRVAEPQVVALRLRVEPLPLPPPAL
ncbi:MAG TPA: hypothetical protein VFE78_13235 [Gemmataceae bacterium]|nr:hypothetical protein [Gemmataceae bacterium]